MMDIKYDELEVFLHIQEAGTFSKASQNIGLSQSALSQKIARLESTLNTSVFVRHPRSLELTEAGEKLQTFAKQALMMRKYFVSNFSQGSKELKGNLRLASFSSVLRSLIFPKLCPLIKKHKSLRLELQTFEMHELENLLLKNATDFIITDFHPESKRLTTQVIGHEEYELISSRQFESPNDIFIDVSAKDNATESFMTYQGDRRSYERVFMGDVYGIINAVESGVGMAVMSKHLIERNKKIKILKTKKKFRRPLVLSYLSQDYYSLVHNEVTKVLSKGLID